MIRITNLKLNLDDAIDYASELANLRKLVCLKYRIKSNNLLLLKIYRKAIDARRKSNVHFVYTVDAEICDEELFLNKNIKNIAKAPDLEYKKIKKGNKDIFSQPVIVGFGPSGLFAALLLSRRGYSPIILERGLDVSKRTKEWNDFLENRTFKDHASILFGEGGAGTFSDGKLTTLISDVRCRFVLEEFVKAGAHPEIMHVNRPHIGTDVLKKVIKNIRDEIIKNGGIVKFNSKVTDFIIQDNKIKGLIVNDTEKISTEVCLLGIGHSARDTFKKLLEKQVKIEPKAFSIGLRIEHNQEMINKSQYGDFYNHVALGAADYKLSYHSDNDRSAYTFCMCPGGFVVNASSQPGTVVTNGMSFSKRDGDNANSALLVNVAPKDFESKHPLAGVEYQYNIEKIAYNLTKNNYDIPVQLVGDFLEDKPTTKIGSIVPTYKPGYEFVELKKILPKYVTQTLKEAIVYFDRKIKGFASKDAVLSGPETRSSSPIRIVRDDSYQSNIIGLYPMGEGAGYAGGIMSSAVDGIKTAEKIIEEFIF
ncbi:MAG: hypothetical protein KAU02_01880 [Tenericutes bacterium]|nr:hypothetical protein [Mycoplasmatota bacterium]